MQTSGLPGHRTAAPSCSQWQGTWHGTNLTAIRGTFLLGLQRCYQLVSPMASDSWHVHGSTKLAIPKFTQLRAMPRSFWKRCYSPNTVGGMKQESGGQFNSIPPQNALERWDHHAWIQLSSNMSLGNFAFCVGSKAIVTACDVSSQNWDGRQIYNVIQKS